MSIARWDPFYELRRIEDRMNRLFCRPGRAWERDQSDFLAASEFAPPVDIYEDQNKFSYKMEIPGINQDDLEIRLDGNTLTVAGERTFEKEEKRENFRRLECQYGCFSRSFDLPSSADRDNIVASFEKGVLRIEIPKHPEARGRQIKVRTGKDVTTKKAVTKAA